MGGFSYVLSLRAMSQMADLMGDRNASARYGSLATKATAEFHSLFWNADKQRYGGDPGAIQSLSLPALDIGAPPTEALHSAVVKTLHDDPATNTNYTLRVGAVTSKILLNILSENGLHETALRTATSTEEPSWGHVSPTALLLTQGLANPASMALLASGGRSGTPPPASRAFKTTPSRLRRTSPRGGKGRPSTLGL